MSSKRPLVQTLRGLTHQNTAVVFFLSLPDVPYFSTQTLSPVPNFRAFDEGSEKVHNSAVVAQLSKRLLGSVS